MSVNIAVLGSKGMLGRYVSKYFSSVGISVNEYDRSNLNIRDQEFLSSVVIRRNDFIINCIGVIKSVVDKNSFEDIIYTNSIFPHVLARICKEQRKRMIHITTDCVFDGKRGKYTEEDTHNPEDIYGKTKSLGEPESCCIIRTSIIGEEKETKRSLVEWIKSQNFKTCNGFINHYWNGVTCLELAKFIKKNIESCCIWEGVRHIHSPEDVSKFELLGLCSSVYGLSINIEPTKAKTYCDRTLRTNRPHIYTCKPLFDQIKEMKGFSIC